jgi:hypothetical protein
MIKIAQKQTHKFFSPCKNRAQLAFFQQKKIRKVVPRGFYHHRGVSSVRKRENEEISAGYNLVRRNLNVFRKKEIKRWHQNGQFPLILLSAYVYVYKCCFAAKVEAIHIVSK